MADAPLVSPLAPRSFPALPDVPGVRLATIAAGVRYEGRTDVMLAALPPGTTLAGAFTRSATRAAPVLDCEAKIDGPGEGGAAFVVNAGNANAFTGIAGVGAVEAIAAAAADRLGVPERRVFTSSTGVIGEPLPHERVTAVLDTLARSLGKPEWEAAARAIMTTDTFPKGAGRSVTLPEGEVQIAGIAKGSGMIAPDMATMLVYIFTDATISRPSLQRLMDRFTPVTFNAITVDSDTSTSDTLLVAATGQGPPVAEAVDGPFAEALHDVMLDLAQQVVRDGEGATKFVEVQVTGALDADDAKRVAMSIANSPLVKTAIAGEDPNWGRIVMAVGKSGARADRDMLSIRLGPHVLAENGRLSDTYEEGAGAAYMTRSELVLAVDLGLGTSAFTAWTCDLTHRYIDINADYRS
ncbi:MAG: bifunctional glutamate N-acetyltransferase/amino-acid acetyltransferase ArgJ [Pseudomonadota bacterium]